MGIADGFWHLMNFLALSFGLGAISALLAKLVWWRELRSAAWPRLAFWAGAAALVAEVGGLLWTGHDGKMITYGAMVLASAAGLAWAGWGPGR